MKEKHQKYNSSSSDNEEEGAEAVVCMCSAARPVLRNFAKFTGKHLCQSLFVNKVAVL